MTVASCNGGKGDGGLALRGYGVAFGERVVLSSVDMALPAVGPAVLLGPAGTGKSTLLRTLVGFNDANPSLRTWGEACLAGAPLGAGPRPAMVSQSARLIMATVLENLAHELPSRPRMTYQEQCVWARQALRRAGLDELGDRLHEPAAGLSLAQQRMLAISRVLNRDPPLLFVMSRRRGSMTETRYVCSIFSRRRPSAARYSWPFTTRAMPAI